MSIYRKIHAFAFFLIAILICVSPLVAQEKPDAEVGRDLILNYPFLPKDFHQSVFEELWKDWPEPLRSKAEKAPPEQRRQMAFDRFGFSSRPEAPEKPMQYVVDDDGYWSINCFSCHGGKVAGENNRRIAKFTIGTRNVVRRHTADQAPHELAIEPDGCWIVSNSNGYDRWDE